MSRQSSVRFTVAVHCFPTTTIATTTTSRPQPPTAQHDARVAHAAARTHLLHGGVEEVARFVELLFLTKTVPA